MDITIEQEKTERNLERAEMSKTINELRAEGKSESEVLEIVKARIFDLRQIVWKAKAREQELYAIMQDSEEFKKQEKALSSFAYTSKIQQENKIESQAAKIDAVLSDMIAKLRKSGTPEAVIDALIKQMKGTKPKIVEKPHFWCKECGHEIERVPLANIDKTEAKVFCEKCGKEMEKR